MKKYSKPEIKVKVVMMQHLMEISAIEIIQESQNPEVSESKMIDIIWDMLGQ